MPELLAQNKLYISFDHRFGDEAFEFQKEFVTHNGEKVSFTLLNYFISNLTLERTDGTVFTVLQDSSYFLVKHEDPTSKTLVLSVPEGKYKELRFMIGVDSLRSTQGAEKRTGVLDVGAKARGMYWQWNSGYIFFKLEGKSEAVPDSTRKSFYYHIGGYGGFDSKTLNNIEIKKLTFDKPLVVKTKKTPEVKVRVDILKFFDGPKPLFIARNHSVMWGQRSVEIADNYVTVFSLESLTYRK